MPDDVKAGVPAELWDAGRDLLLEIARQPDNIKRAAAIIAQAKSDALGQYVARRTQFDQREMPCGHKARYWEPVGSVDDFVADPEKHGRCVVCAAARIAVAKAVRERADSDRPMPIAF